MFKGLEGCCKWGYKLMHGVEACHSRYVKGLKLCFIWLHQIHPSITTSCTILSLCKVCFMLKRMGFDRNSIYQASRYKYNSERYMPALLEMLPLLQSKDMLASPDELAQYQV
ncbi:hypothetical protein CTI12_AA308370 [Artemisia annua]|uniref:Uncharacterized protein n=1 Tax=Artemisia annua TaxID=35608 RepID=A0A2U1M0N9_ARTAN|nr:hypothetical protein CTI12_AA308370 [Artemisia annua]